MSEKRKFSIREDFQLYRRLLVNYILPKWPAFLLAIGGSIAFSGIDACVTYLFKPLLDEGFIHRNDWFIRWAPWLIMSVFLLRGMAQFASNYFMTWVARSVIKTFRQQIFQHLLRLPTTFYDHHSTGALLSKLLYDVEQIAKISTDSITELVQSICLIIGLFIVMSLISWKLTLLYFITAPFIAIVIRKSSIRIRHISRSVQRVMGDVTEIAEESIEGHRVVKIFAGQQYETEKFDRAAETSLRRDMKVELTKAFSISGVQLIAALGISTIVYLAISPHSVMFLSAGGFVSMIVAVLALLKPMKSLTTVNVVIQRGLAGAQSVFALLDEPPETDTGKTLLKTRKAAIAYDAVSFAYHLDSTPVLKNISFYVQPGETVALVGRSGGGKSTLVSLLPRFYDVSHGCILLNDIPIQQIPLKNLREQIALVSQQVTLFNDTIAQNIAYGSGVYVSDEAIVRAAEAAHAMEFIRELPQGIHTLVGENGILLSGGQRQRIAIARALLKNAPILILDEATSALDTESERHIQSALETLMRDRTTLVIAHRLSTIERADLIMVIENGEIVERGTHHALIKKQGAYARLHNMQFKTEDMASTPLV